MIPDHVVPFGSAGGVALFAEQVADAVGAEVRRGTLAELDDLAAGRDRAWHLHFADRQYGATPFEAARRVARWAAAGPLSVTLHDLPQAWSSPARRRCYVEVATSARSWVVSSHHEIALLGAAGDVPGPGQVIHLPVTRSSAALTPPAPGVVVTLGVAGWVYPDKGHREVVRAAARLARTGRAVRVRCLGAAVEGHADLVEELHQRARRGGVDLEVSGFLDDARLDAAMRTVTVPVAAHQHHSASGSINTWLGAGRRPLVADGRYPRELAALRPGTLLLFDAHDDSGGGLDRAVRQVLRDAAQTWLPDGVRLGPFLADTAAAYRALWAATSYAGPQPTKPERPVW